MSMKILITGAGGFIGGFIALQTPTASAAPILPVPIKAILLIISLLYK